jgi:hypothetical protein
MEGGEVGWRRRGVVARSSRIGRGWQSAVEEVRSDGTVEEGEERQHEAVEEGKDDGEVEEVRSDDAVEQRRGTARQKRSSDAVEARSGDTVEDGEDT